MPIKITQSRNYANNIAFSDFFQKQNRNVILLTHYRENNPYYDTINSVILEKLIELDLQNIEWDCLSDHLENFFIDLNWQLNALFRQTVDIEKGASLLLVVVEGKSLCCVRFGRFLCGVISENNDHDLTEEWSNYRVKTVEQLGLLGSLEQDIFVKPKFFEMKENQQLLCCSSESIDDVNVKSLNIFNTVPTFKKRFDTKPFPYAIIDFSGTILPSKRSWFKAKKFRFTVLAMLLMLTFSVYYMFKGDNTVEDRLHIIREQFQLEVRNIDVLKIQELLPLDYGILLVPQRNIELFIEWESVLPFEVTLPPNYDLRQIFLSSNNKIYSYDKRDKKNSWTAELPDKLISVEILDANLMVVTTILNESFCLKRDTGDIIWMRKGTSDSSAYHKRAYKPVQISLEMDRRLNNSIVLFPDENNLALLNILNGDTLYYYESSSKIDFISDFDFIDKCIYLVKGSRLYKVRFDIRA